MANPQIAYRITSSWEGRWSKVPEKGSLQEESAYNEWWGTNYGLTGSFMRDFAGWKKSQKSQFQNMNIDQAGEVWKRTRWTWAKLDNVNDQEIANLMFDWGVRRWNNMIKGVAKALNVPEAAITQKVKMIDVGGNPPKKTDGFYILNNYAIQLINSHPDPQKLHASIKSLRWELDGMKNETRQSLKARYQSFVYMGTEPKDVLLASSDAKKRSLIIQDKQNKKTGFITDSIITDILIVAIVGKAAKKW